MSPTASQEGPTRPPPQRGTVDLRQALTDAVTKAEEEQRATGIVSQDRIESIERLKKLIELGDDVRTRRTSRAAALVIIVLGVLASILVTWLRVPSASIAIDATVSAIRFRPTAKVDVGQSRGLLARSVRANSVDSVTLRGVVGKPDTTIGDRSILFTATPGSGIAIAGMSADSGQAVRLSQTANTLALSLGSEPHASRLDLQGRIAVMTDHPQMVSFRDGSALLWERRASSGLEVNVADDSITRDLTTAARIDSLQLYTVSRAAGDPGAAARFKSAVYEGKLSFLSMDSVGISLNERDAIELVGLRGDLAPVQLRSGRLTVRYRGDVRRIYANDGVSARPLMPTWFAFLRAQHTVASLYVAIAWVITTLLAIIRWFGPFRARRAIFPMLAVAVTTRAATATAQGIRLTTEQKQLVVSISSTLQAPGGSEPISRIGAGIVVAVDDSTLFVATAKHVVALSGPSSGTFCVGFRTSAATDCSPAHRMEVSGMDSTLDLAFLRMPRPRDVPEAVSPRFLAGRLGDPGRLRFRDPVQIVGCPAGLAHCWDDNAESQVVEGVDLSEIVFHTTSVDPGNSGGGLFNRWGELIGMVVTRGQNRAHAIRVDIIISQLQLPGMRSLITHPSYPRGGYTSTLQAEWLMTSRGAGVPSGRFTISRQLTSLLSWHIGALRLAPRNISVVAGTVGGSIDIRRGRMTLSPFAEAGIGEVEAQYDAGGYIVTTNAQSRYIPFWRPLQGSALGGGGGLQFSFVLAPQLLLNGTVGSWGFTTPDLSPRLPHTSAGLGLSWGVSAR